MTIDPFPNRSSRWHGLLDAIVHLDGVRLRQVDNALVIAALTLLFALVSSVLLIMLPLIALRGGPSADLGTRIKLRTLGYFLLLGPAFLFTEIAWIQHLELFLDQPLYAAAIALSTFLLFAGLGSLWVQRVDDRATARPLLAAVAVIGVFAAVFALTGSAVLTSALGWPFPVRLLLATLLLAPLAFAMGVPFAVGLRRFGGISPRLIPWAWGINGCASVISAASAAVHRARSRLPRADRDRRGRLPVASGRFIWGSREVLVSSSESSAAEQARVQMVNGAAMSRSRVCAGDRTGRNASLGSRSRIGFARDSADR